jgi:hypothetical protein
MTSKRVHLTERRFASFWLRLASSGLRLASYEVLEDDPDPLDQPRGDLTRRSSPAPGCPSISRRITMKDRSAPPPGSEAARLLATLAEIGPAAFTAADYKPGLIRHIVCFRFAATTTAAQRAAVTERFLALQDACRRGDGSRYLLGVDTGPQRSGEGADKGLEQGFIVTLRSQGDRNYYVGSPIVTDPAWYDPAHQAFKDSLQPPGAPPLLADSLVFDFPVERQAYLRADPASD